MCSSHDWLWVQAARLFSMADEARENGDSELANLLTKGACRCLDQLAEHERVELSGPSACFH